MTFNRLRVASMRWAVCLLWIVVPMGIVQAEEGRYIAKRTAGRSASTARAPGTAGVGLRVGDIERPVAGEAQAASLRSLPRVRRGVTPAGGMTIELDGRFNTLLRVGAVATGEATLQCGATDRR